MSKSTTVLKMLGVSVREGAESGIKNYSDDILLRVLSGTSDDVIGAVGTLGDDVVATGMRRVVDNGVVRVINSETGAVLAEVSEASLKALDDEILSAALRGGAQELGEGGLRIATGSADDLVGAGAREAVEETVERVAAEGLTEAIEAAAGKTAAEAAEIFAEAGVRNSSQLGRAAQELFAGNVDDIIEFGTKSGIGRNAAGQALTGRAQGRAIGEYARAAGIGRGQVDDLVHLARDLGLEPTKRAMAGFARGAGLNTLRSTEMTEIFVTRFMGASGLAARTASVLDEVVELSRFTPTRLASGALSMSWTGVKNAPTIVKTGLTVTAAGGLAYGAYKGYQAVSAVERAIDRFTEDTPEEAARKIQSAQEDLATKMLPRGEHIPEGSEVFYDFREVNGREMTFMYVTEPGAESPREIATGKTKEEFLELAAEMEKKHGVEKEGQGIVDRVMGGIGDLFGGMGGPGMLIAGVGLLLGGGLLSGLLGKGIGAASGIGFLGGAASSILGVVLPIAGLVMAGVGIMKWIGGNKEETPTTDSPLASEVTRDRGRGGRDGNERVVQPEELSEDARREAVRRAEEAGNGVRTGDDGVSHRPAREADTTARVRE